MLSVIIPTYNRRRFLAEAVRSLTDQGIADLEILVVDDGSTDGTEAIARDLPVRYWRQPRQGPSAARNRGREAARGDVIYFLDSDDVCIPGALREAVAYLEAHPGEAAVGGGAGGVIGEDGRSLRDIRDAYVTRVRYPERLTWEFFREGGRVPPSLSQFVFRAGALREIGGFDERLRAAEDMDFVLRFLRHHSIPLLPRPFFWYRVHGGNSVVRIVGDQLKLSRWAVASSLLVEMAHGLKVSHRWPGLYGDER